FHHVVVGPGLQAAHDVEVITAGGQHDDRHVAAAAHPPADLEAVHPGQHHVEHHDVHRVLADALQRCLPGLGGAHLIAAAAPGPPPAPPGRPTRPHQQPPRPRPPTTAGP